VESLQLKAAILGTYTFEIQVLQQEFPSLFGKQQEPQVPTFVMHGKKGWKRNSTTTENDTEDDEESRASESEYISDAQKQPNVDSMTMTDDEQESLELPETVHFAEITTTWMEDHHHHQQYRPRSFRDAIDPDTGWIRSDIVQRRKYKPGVHHPKFMILFETNGAVVVVISTANFTNPNASIDASWLQRFYPSSQPSSSHHHHPDHANDFGSVFTNFLQATILATAPHQWTLHAFVQKYLGWKSILDLERMFDFTKAQVHLIPTIPGNYPLLRHLPSSNHQQQQQQQTQKQHPKSEKPYISTSGSIQPSPKTRKHFTYGPQRVAEIISTRRRKQQPTTSEDTSTNDKGNFLMTEHDRLLFQPTSLGAEWNIHTMAHLVRTYLGIDNEHQHHYDQDETIHNDTQKTSVNNMNNSYPYSDAEILERMDIIWPTESFVRRFANPSMQRPTSSFSTDGPSSSYSSSDRSGLENDSSSGILFLSSTTFNKIDLSCLSRMAIYEPSIPHQSPNIRPPHFKSVARLLSTPNDKHKWIQRHGIPPCQEYFSWFLLTSACLSRGAQGERILTTQNTIHPCEAEISYSNFELGVLFLSDLVGGDTSSSRRQNGRIYGWRPSQCTCQKPSTSPKVIHLPCPYNVRPPSYVEDPDRVEFCEIPFMHEILPESARIGHMRMTPHGVAFSRNCNETK
jgi:hypothetical protein